MKVCPKCGFRHFEKDCPKCKDGFHLMNQTPLDLIEVNREFEERRKAEKQAEREAERKQAKREERLTLFDGPAPKQQQLI